MLIYLKFEYGTDESLGMPGFLPGPSCFEVIVLSTEPHVPNTPSISLAHV